MLMFYRLLYLLVSISVYFLWESWDSCYSSTLIDHCQNASIYCVMVFMNKDKNKQQTWFNQVNTTILTAIHPRSLLRISTTFYWHCFQKKYTHFCQHHDKTCCPDCISTNHKDCVGLLSVHEIIKTSKTSTFIYNIEQNLTDIKNNIDKIMKNRQQNMSMFWMF